MIYTVVTKIPNPNKGEIGNLYNGFTNMYYEEEIDKYPYYISHPITEHPNAALFFDIMCPVFKLGEILVLNEFGRDIWGRKPTKWWIETQNFRTYARALEKAKQVLMDSENA